MHERRSIRYNTLLSTIRNLFALHYPRLTPTAIMPKSCIICSAVASPDHQLQWCCAQCQSALYCSRACQRKDWKKQHKKICKLLNVGHGDRQLRTEEHTSRSIEMEEAFEKVERSLGPDDKRFFKLFEESTLEESQATAREMRKIAKSRTKYNQKCVLFHCLHVLVRSSKSEMLLSPNSPLLVMLHFVDPSVLSPASEETSFTALHNLSNLLDP
jgi:hypothetical protein